EPFGAPDNVCPASVPRPAVYFYVETVSGSTSALDVAISCSSVSVPAVSASGPFTAIQGSYSSSTGIAKVFVGGFAPVHDKTVVVRSLPGRRIALSTAPVWFGARAINGFHGWFTGNIDDAEIIVSS
ncbi:MAG TPA: hypothetical protein VGR41_08440, partial [Actinomycetota bacterium]|nr:hypothetical protein [Actinomycetota bacterium]